MKLWHLNTLHIFNDGFLASILLFLPFIAAGLGLTLTEVGILGTIVNSLAIVLSVPAGYLAIKIGGFKSLVIAVFLYGLAFVGVGFSQTYFWLFPMFFLAGTGFALFHPIGMSLIIRFSKKEERGRRMGDFMAIGEVGRIAFAAALTFIVVVIGWQNTSILFGAIALSTAIFFLIIFKRHNERIVVDQGPETKIKITTILSNKKFMFASLSNFFDAFGNNSVFLFLPFLLLYRGVDPALLGSFTAAFFIGTLTGKTAIGRMIDIHGSVKIFVICEILMAALILIMASATWLPLILVSSVILGFFTKGTIPITKIMVSESVEHHGDFEKAFGVNNAITAIAATATPILMGFVADKYGIIAAFICMAVSVVFAIIPALLFKFTKQQKHVN